MTWLIDFSLKTALLLGAARVAAFLLRRGPADVRHRLWLAALLGVAILALPVSLPRPVTVGVPVHFSVTALEGALPAAARGEGWPLWTAIWTAGIAAAMARLLAGVLTVALWTRRARRVNRVLISDLAATPLTWGVFRPVILFPACATGWPAGRVELALRHEQAHIARRDWLWQMLAGAMNAVFWFHPLVWLACAELRREAENATDDLVLASGVDAADYAEQLVQVARSISGAQRLMAAVPMARNKLLESRVREILNPVRRRSQASPLARAAVTVLVCACLALLLAVEDHSVLRAARTPLASPATMPDTRVDTGARTAEPVRPRGATAPASQVEAAPPAVPSLPAPLPISSPGLTPPKLIYKIDPGYTDDARAARLQGVVVLSVVIDEQGRAEDMKVSRSLDPGLDEEAMEAVRHWQFSPGLKDGAPVAVIATIEVNFRLL